MGMVYGAEVGQMVLNKEIMLTELSIKAQEIEKTRNSEVVVVTTVVRAIILLIAADTVLVYSVIPAKSMAISPSTAGVLGIRMMAMMSVSPQLQTSIYPLFPVSRMIIMGGLELLASMLEVSIQNLLKSIT